MAGGVGSRFWPFSTNKKPKQFLDFFGTGRSFLQMTYDRFCKIVPSENIYIASNSNYKDLILEQLPELSENQVLLEPARRNTAPCIAYAMNKIYSLNKDANVIVSPSDHLILKEDDFVETIKEGLEYTRNNDNILTLGIKPNRPETGYGYIQIAENDENSRFYKAKTFTEKPNIELAKIFLDSGEFLWNSGMFIWNVKTIIAAFDSYLSEVSNKFKAGAEFYGTSKEQEYINSIYQSCTNISIDYAILEKADNVHVLSANFGWSDLGTWGSIYEHSEKDENQNYVHATQRFNKPIVVSTVSEEPSEDENYFCVDAYSQMVVKANLTLKYSLHTGEYNYLNSKIEKDKVLPLLVYTRTYDVDATSYNEVFPEAKQSKTKKMIFVIIFIIILAVSAPFTAYYWTKHSNSDNNLNDRAGRAGALLSESVDDKKSDVTGDTEKFFRMNDV